MDYYMRLATVDHERTTRAVVQADDRWWLLDADDVGALIQRPRWREEVTAAIESRPAGRDAGEAPPLLRPLLQPTKVICCGLNYRDHIQETGRVTPDYPTLFAKYADTLADPDEELRIEGSNRIDWEAELAVVVGSDLIRADREAAQQAILGFTIANDVSMRDWQSRTLQWFQGKAWDRTTPIGPVIVTADEIDPTNGLEIGARIGDEVVQTSNTRELVFDSAALLAYISQFTTLRAGDLVLTGTPGGVGLGRTPQRFLADGEILTTWIESIGELTNAIRIRGGAA